MGIKTHGIDRGKQGTEGGVHIVPHTKPTAGSSDYSSGVGTAEGPDGASLSIWPGEEACGLCITLARCCTCV